MAEVSRWLEKIIKSANEAAPNGIVALALVFGILMALVVLLK